MEHLNNPPRLCRSSRGLCGDARSENHHAAARLAPATHDVPAGRHTGDAARDWDHAALLALAQHLAAALSACTSARSEAASVRTVPATLPRAAARHLLEIIASAGESLDEAHELAYQMSLPGERYCARCGTPLIPTPGRPGWQHAPISGPPASGHQPQVTSRPPMRPAITGNRVDPASMRNWP